MSILDSIKSALGRHQPRALEPPTKGEQEQVDALRAEFKNLPAGVASREVDAESEWLANVERLSQLVAEDDPRDFLNWDVIRSTMFVDGEPYIAQELRHLQGLPDWASRWEPAIREWAAGNPPPYSLHPASSGTLIHHAFHVAKFEQATGVKASDLKLVVEFGGGYGSMRRLFHQLGFSGNYVILDLPPFSALQRYFLAAGGIGPDSITCVADVDQLAEIIEAQASTTDSLLIGTWSISEAPVELRDRLLPVAGMLDSHLIAYQDVFSGEDNVAYFSDWQGNLDSFEWQEEKIREIPGDNRYLFGTAKG